MTPSWKILKGVRSKKGNLHQLQHKLGSNQPNACRFNYLHLDGNLLVHIVLYDCS